MSRLRDYLLQGTLLQLATCDDNQPWVCTVYYVADDQQNLYWLSFPSRRHSKELALNNKAAIAIVIKADLPVIGIQAEGTVEIVKDAKVVKKIMEIYVAKYKEGTKFYDNFVAGKNQHEMYKLSPSHFVLFDETNDKS
jgi:uncharacterized protein YhbP (UPF0306 family)